MIIRFPISNNFNYHQSYDIMNLNLGFVAVLIVFSLFVVVRCDEDYYDTLGVAKDASNKEIRKAFKKLALIHHPDKNVNDPEAHEKFLKITKIYDVLKDEELRKKYDRYGEEGLKEDFKGGGYESYSFYKNEFGIYDDDAEVTTLDKADFDAAVKSGETWFINFYSPRCSHCHDLAPTWRLFAQEMEGIVNIGAMNCRDNRWTCSENGIHSYPSLVIFVAGSRWRELARDLQDIVNIGALECGGRNRFWCLKKNIRAFPNLRVYHNNSEPIMFRGDRNKRDLTKFVMQYVTVEVVDLWSGNWEAETKKAARKSLPWVVSYCGGSDGSEDDEINFDGDCPTKKTIKKLSGMLRSLATVAVIDCGVSADLCEKLGNPQGVMYYPKESFPDSPQDAKSLNSLDAREIYNEIMKNLIPGLPTVTSSALKKTVVSKPMLVFFQFGDQVVDQEDTSLKKLPIFLKPHRIEIGILNCEKDKEFCQDKMFIKESSIAVFKGRGLDMFEFYHGRRSTSELSAFSQESSRSKVTTLNPEIFEDGDINSSKKPWFVDFFAPWCPPCRALLPELRQASLVLSDINFGTIDCTIHRSTCDDYGINSYPTTMLFNGSIVTEYHGQHNSYGIKQFVEDLINPPYEHLTPKTFQTKVQRRAVGETWIVDFYASWCGPCQQLLPEWRKMAKTLNGMVLVGAIDCAKPGNGEFCKRHAVEAYPEIRLYPARERESHNPVYEIHRGWNRRSFALSSWALQYIPSEVKDLTNKDFKDGFLVDEDPWLIDFYAPWCSHCHMFAPKFTLTSVKLKDRVKCGKIDCQSYPGICGKAGVNAYPSVKFYPPTKTGQKKNAKFDIHTQDPDQIVMEVERYLKQYGAEEKGKSKKTKKSKKDEL